MANASFVQSNYQGGEWSKTAQGRFDDPRYKTALALCLNAYPLEEGSCARRPGTMHGATTRGGVAARVLPFAFTASAPYTMEFSDGHLRFFNGTSLLTASQATISAFSTANPAVLTPTADPGWATGTEIRFTFGNNATKVACAFLADTTYKVTSLGGGAYAVFNSVTGNPVNGASHGWTSSLNLTVAAVVDIVTPYTNGLWQDLRVIQNEDLMLLLHPSVAPQALTYDPLANSFSLAPVEFVDGPYLDAFQGSLLTPSGLTGNITVSLSFTAYSATTSYSTGDYVTSGSFSYQSLQDFNLNNTPASSPTFWTVVNPAIAAGPNGFQTSDVGRPIKIYSEPSLWVAATAYGAGAFVTFNGGYYKAVTGSTGSQPDISPSAWVVDPAAFVVTWGRISGTATTGFISGTLTGSTNIGNMTDGGGLASAFDGTVSKPATSCAERLAIPSSTFTTAYCGKNYTGAGAQSVSSVIITPSNDTGFVFNNFSSLTMNLRAKSTAPANSSDGTLLGTKTIAADTSLPITITSNNPSSTWNYVWIEFTFPSTVSVNLAQAQIYGGSAAAGSSATVQIIGPNLLYTTAARTWKIGAYSPSTGYPANGCFHEGRFWLAGAIENRFDASKSEDPFNFATTNSAGVTADDNAISRTFDSSDRNQINWMMPDLQGIIAGTLGGEWIIQASNANNPLTPTSIQAHRITKYGCANIEPKRTGLTTVFVQKFKRRINEFMADMFSGKFLAPNLTAMAKHITKGSVEELAYQEELTPILWARKADGTVAGATYRRQRMVSYEPPEVLGWHRTAPGSNRLIESICVGPSTDGLLDTLAMVTNDPETGIRHVEFATNLFDEDDELTDAWFLDNASTPIAAVSQRDTGTYGGLPVSIVADFVNDFYVYNDVVYTTFAAWLAALGGTFTSSANGTFVNSAGLIQQATANVPRKDYDPITHACKGFLLEGLRQNLNTHGQAYNNASWTTFGTTIVDGVVNGPAGLLTASLLIQDTSSGLHRIRAEGVSVSPATLCTVSQYMEVNGSRYVTLNASALINASSTFDLQSGTVVATTSGSANISPAGSNRYRLSVTGISGASPATQYFIQIENAASGSTTYTGDGVSGFNLWGSQVEQAGFASSYIPTTSAAVTRAADTFHIPQSVLPSNMGTIVATAGLLEGSTSSGRIVGSIGSGGGFTPLFVEATGTVAASSYNEISSLDTPTTANWTTTQPTVGVSWSGGTRATCLNGGAVATDNTGFGQNGTAFSIGSDRDTFQWLWGRVASLKMFPVNATSAQLQTLTGNGPLSYVAPVATGLRLYGLRHLDRKTVTVWLGGMDCGDYPVEHGYCTVPYGKIDTVLSTTLTQAFLQSLSTSGATFKYPMTVDGLLTVPCVVGFTYTTRGQALRPVSPQDTGAQQGPGFGKSRRSSKYAVQLVNAQGVSFGTDFTKMRAAQLRTKGGRPIGNALYSGIHKDTIDDDNSLDGQLAWELTRPYPCTIAGLGGYISTQDE